MNFLLSLWYRYKEWRFERKCIKYFGAKPERIVLPAKDFDALVERLNQKPKFNQRLFDLMSKKAPWDEDT